MPENTAEQILSKISDTIAYKIEASNGDQVIKYRSSQDGYIALKFSCTRTASGETNVVDADFDLEPPAALQKMIQRDGPDIKTLGDNIRERALKDDMLQRRVVYLYLIGKPCDSRNLVSECLNVLASKKPEMTKAAAPVPKRLVAPVSFIDAKAELDAMTVYSMNSFETKRQLSYPSDNEVGILIVTQPLNSAEYTIKFVLNGRHDVIERTYKADKAAGKTIFGRIFSKSNNKFIGLLGAN